MRLRVTVTVRIRAKVIICDHFLIFSHIEDPIEFASREVTH